MHRILIAESDPNLRGDLLRAVRNAGYFSDAVECADETEDRLAEIGFDAVILNIADSADLDRLERVVASNPAVAVLATGSNPSVDFAVEAMKRGARDLLRKPFSIEVLETALSALLKPRDKRGRAVGMGAEIITQVPEMQELLERAISAAATQATLQIVGESGTGKELLSRFIHCNSSRRTCPFVAVNCAALPDSLWESELFGHERGAFSGADEARIGQIAAADGGTLLLDEVSDISLELQPKLLRVLQEREVRPVGSIRPRSIDVRILTTTQRDLRKEVEAGRFREDLYYRLDVISLHLPPLRNRLDDIGLLGRTFLERYAHEAGSQTPLLTEQGLDRLRRHEFRGNVRELENLMRRAAVLYAGREIDVDVLLARRGTKRKTTANVSGTLNLRELERRTIFQSLIEADGNRTAASRVLGISVRTLRNKIRSYELQ